MTMISAIFEGGMLKPTEPLSLREGQEVRVTVHPPTPESLLPQPTPEEEEYGRRLRACKSIAEWLAVTQTLPPDDGGYDVIKQLNENRRFSGWYRMLGSPEGQS